MNSIAIVIIVPCLSAKRMKKRKRKVERRRRQMQMQVSAQSKQHQCIRTHPLYLLLSFFLMQTFTLSIIIIYHTN